jgi:uncharacterized protein YrrD
MLFRFGSLNGMPLEATDGEVGRIKDALFDDHRWAMRYLVVDARTWLAGRKVLISPIALKKIDWQRNVVQVDVTRQQIEESPSVDTDEPVSRRHEADFLDHYGYPYYWSGPALWGSASHPVNPARGRQPANDKLGMRGVAPIDPQLRSTTEVAGFRLQTSGDPMVHVEDFLFDTVTWAIRYLVVDTRNWLPGKHVVIPPQWITSVDWNKRVVNVDVTRRTLEAAPEYQSSIEFSSAHETNLHRHYHRDGYWQ